MSELKKLLKKLGVDPEFNDRIMEAARRDIANSLPNPSDWFWEKSANERGDTSRTGITSMYLKENNLTKK